MTSKQRNIFIVLLVSLLIVPPMFQGMLQPDEPTVSSHTVQIMITSDNPAYYNGTLTIEYDSTIDIIHLEILPHEEPSPMIILPFNELKQNLQYRLTYEPIDYVKIGPYTLYSMDSHTIHDPAQVVTIRVYPISA